MSQAEYRELMRRVRHGNNFSWLCVHCSVVPPANSFDAEVSVGDPVHSSTALDGTSHDIRLVLGKISISAQLWLSRAQ